MWLRRRWRMLGLLLVVVIVPVFTSAAWAQGKYKTLHRFERSGPDGYALPGGLIFDRSGNLYGTTAFGGAKLQGTVFELIPQSNGAWAAKVLHSFTGGTDGGGPVTTLIFDRVGNLYGTAQLGGIYSAGIVFKLAPNQDGSWTESVLHSFGAGSDGSLPTGGLVFDQSGNLYGKTLEGGSTFCRDGCGTVFKLAANSDGSWTESLLHSFCLLDGCREGANPFGDLTFDQAGNLYGTTSRGGDLSQCYGAGCGLVFQLMPNADGSWKETVLHHFCSGSSCDDGETPGGGLIFDQRGNLYGTTELGGTAGDGVVFRLAPNSDGSWKEKVLHNFTGADGVAPDGSLIFDQAGNLFGTTQLGGDLNRCGRNGCGVVFRLALNSKGGWRETALHAFYDQPGCYPNAGVIFDSAGNLYGTTYGDSGTTLGSVFEITP